MEGVSTLTSGKGLEERLSCAAHFLGTRYKSGFTVAVTKRWKCLDPLKQKRWVLL